MTEGLIVGDVRDILPTLPDGIAQTCVCSPPYWGLRDYGVDGQIGLEPTPEQFVETMVEIFREVRRVLADDGTLWLNLGDSYSMTTRGKGGDGKQSTNAGTHHAREWQIGPGLKPKDLIGIPWRVALALQADGWILRSDIIWHKPNPMPESVGDRPTKAHEYLFLMAKQARYYYDADAIREAHSEPWRSRSADSYRESHGPKEKQHAAAIMMGAKTGGHREYNPAGRNRLDVWTVNPEPFSEAHFATFPRKLIEPCIAAGSRVGDLVLDPFIGSGTTAMVAQDLGRRWLGCELNPEYAEMVRRRTAQMAMTL